MALEMKHFVLTPGKNTLHGQAARNAMLCYAETVAPDDSQLARDLEEWVASIEARLEEQAIEEEQAVIEEVREAYAQEVTPLVLEEDDEEIERM